MYVALRDPAILVARLALGAERVQVAPPNPRDSVLAQARHATGQAYSAEDLVVAGQRLGVSKTTCSPRAFLGSRSLLGGLLCASRTSPACLGTDLMS